jgi:YjbE family integral membrane protein
LDLDNLQKIFSIIVVDLLLSGDNAVVIGMAARNLNPDYRRKAILWGGVGAIVLRIFFTILAALLLDIPFLQAMGAVLLVYIAFKLVVPAQEDDGSGVRIADTLGGAIKTIILANMVMSLDNILAVGGTAKGNLILLLFGLGLSIPLLLIGSDLVARLLQNIPWLLILGVLVLVHTSIQMFLHDGFVEDLIGYVAPEWEILAASLVTTLALLAFVKWTRGSVAGLDEPAGAS